MPTLADLGAAQALYGADLTRLYDAKQKTLAEAQKQIESLDSAIQDLEAKHQAVTGEIRAALALQEAEIAKKNTPKAIDEPNAKPAKK